MRTKFKPWAEPFIREHNEVIIQENDIVSLNDIYLEIGSGKGLFLKEMALKFPDRYFVGIEKNVTCAGFTAKKLVDFEVNNAKLIYGDAGQLLIKLQDCSVNKIYLNFSDPWPKVRHHKRRLTSNSFLNLYKRILKKDALIVFKTDNKDLFDFSLTTFEENGFKLVSVNYNYDGCDYDDFPTEYETSFREENKPIYRVEVKINE